MGYHEGGRLKFAGKVGTGFGTAMLESLTARLRQARFIGIRQDKRAVDVIRERPRPA